MFNFVIDIVSKGTGYQKINVVGGYLRCEELTGPMMVACQWNRSSDT